MGLPIVSPPTVIFPRSTTKGTWEYTFPPHNNNTGNLYGEAILDADAHYSIDVPCESLQEKQIFIYAIEGIWAGAVPPNLSIWLEVSPFAPVPSTGLTEAVPAVPWPFIGPWPWQSRPALFNGLGDINGDGVVDFVDLVDLWQHIAAGTTGDYTIEQRRRADINCDGVIDIADRDAGNAYIETGTIITALATEFNLPYTMVGVPTIIVPDLQVSRTHGINLPVTLDCQYLRVGIQAAAVVADAWWTVRAVFTAKTP